MTHFCVSYGDLILHQSSLQANIALLLPVFEQFLDMAPDTSAHDTIRQSVIILMGCLARHLDKDDPKVRTPFKNTVMSQGEFFHYLVNLPLSFVSAGVFKNVKWM